MFFFCFLLGIYLPLLWQDPNQCHKRPLFVAYTDNHFSALIPEQPLQPLPSQEQSSADVASEAPQQRQSQSPTRLDFGHLPLFKQDGQPMPIRFTHLFSHLVNCLEFFLHSFNSLLGTAYFMRFISFLGFVVWYYKYVDGCGESWRKQAVYESLLTVWKWVILQLPAFHSSLHWTDTFLLRIIPGKCMQYC